MNFKIPKSLKPLYPKHPYHNLAHVESFDFSTCPSPEAFWAAVFHDMVYFPRNNGNNEALSYQRFIDFYNESPSYEVPKCDTDKVKALILSTKNHVESYDPNDRDMIWLHMNDLACFRTGANIQENEKKIFREFQFTKFDYFKERRIRVLEHYKKHPLCSVKQIDDIIAYLNNWQPKFGIYCGSFNPFHRGHMDIVHQAEKVFDKVIIAQGQNEDKETNKFSLHSVSALQNYELDIYNGSLFSYLDQKKAELKNVSLIRGLRNYHDLHDESSIFNFGVQCTDVPFVYFISKSENLHISSGAIRKLQSLGKDVSTYLP